MPYSPAGKNLMLNALGATVYASLHSGSVAPTQAAPNEISGGTYARKQVTLGTAASGSRPGTGLPVTFDIPANVTVTFVAYWDQLSGGTLLSYFDIPDESFSSNGGQANINVVTFNITDVVGG